jgi:hypothetical protein
MKYAYASSGLLAAVCLVLVLTGCDPLGPVNQKGLDSELAAPAIRFNGASATMAQIEWQPVYGAASYRITVKKTVEGGDPVLVSSTDRSVEQLVAGNSFSNGYFSYSVKHLDGKKAYDVFIVAQRDLVESAPRNTVVFTTKDPYESAPDIKPDAYIQEVTANTATVVWRTIPGITKYVLTLSAQGTSAVPPVRHVETVDGDAGTYAFSGLDENLNYTIRIQAAVEKNNGELDTSLVYAQLDVNRATGGVVTDASMPVPLLVAGSIDAKAQSVSMTVRPNPAGVSTSANYVMLLRKDTVNGDFAAVAWSGIPSGDVEVVLVDDHLIVPGTLYYYALCNVEASGTGGISAIEKRSRLSDTVQVASALKISTDSTPNSIAVSWPDLGDDIRYTITVSDADGVTKQLSADDLSIENGIASLVYGGNGSPLVSRSEYAFAVVAATPANVRFSGNAKATTGSWAGEYRWVNPKDSSGGRANFSVTVEVVPLSAGSSYPYYVRVNSKDAAYVAGGDYRILPLIDPAVETVPDGYIPYGTDTTPFEKAYIWNNQKWNTLGIAPDSWRIKTSPTVDDMKKNIYTTLVNTKAMGMTLETTTTFQFRMYDGKPQLLFTNKGTGVGAGFVNMGLYQNPEPLTAAGEGKYTFALSRIQEAGE